MQWSGHSCALKKYPSWFCYEMKIENNHSRAKWEWRASLQPWPPKSVSRKSWFPLVCPDGTPCAKDILAMTRLEDRAWRASNAKVRRGMLYSDRGHQAQPTDWGTVLGQWLHQWVSLNSESPRWIILLARSKGSTSYFLIWVIFLHLSRLNASLTTNISHVSTTGTCWQGLDWAQSTSKLMGKFKNLRFRKCKVKCKAQPAYIMTWY